MRPVSEATARITGKSFSRKYIALGRIISHWDDIAGKDLADKAQPVRVRYHKYKNSKTPQISLEIATTSAHATALHYQKDLIIERINRFFGEGWVTAIRFVTLPVNLEPPKRKPGLKTLSDKEKESLCALLQAIDDPEVKIRLEKLGEAVISEGK